MKLKDGPWDVPSGWCWLPLQDVAEPASGDWGTEPDAAEINALVVRSTETRSPVVEVSEASLRGLTRRSLEKTRLQLGDILVVKSSGSQHLVGRPSIVRELGADPAGFSNFMLRLRVTVGVALPEWLFAYLVSEMGRSQFLRLQNTTSGLRNLQLKQYFEIPVPVAPLDVQEVAVTKFLAAVRVRSHLEDLSSELTVLEAALAADAFSVRS